MSGRYLSGVDFPAMGSPWGHTADFNIDIRDQWGSPMRSSSFKVVIQMEMDPGQYYLIPGENGFLQADGFYIWLLNASSPLRGLIHLAAYSSAGTNHCQCQAIGSCWFDLPDPRSRRPRHPVRISARLGYRSGSTSHGISSSAAQALTRTTTDNPATTSATGGGGVSQSINFAPSGGIGGTTTGSTTWSGTRTDPSQTTARGVQRTVGNGTQDTGSRETREALKTFDMHPERQ